ncbi:uncharacterized protein CANTADRAFT_23667 [Suhomyces tanzawaensis NRRL Y-17324]|uniref:Uncharacterized protein n=1 Tax=Suhomyces tanzawaensis NRRL Y-17324 TaxID=984487 RepID=A0A1E4SDT2_9ASCO|nr:uncharacterized protein CANTADRAFT_23667 [Suhomyces tanzawaensis NRRL Y-17324]ODV77552.1 hypothetical protein CANTADRAFT_23667 [Suhomyces tanzawaensis NRRL Y-17324]
MFSASGTNTPIPGGAAAYHDQLGENVTWVKDWYNPATSYDANGEGTLDTIRLKGWFKTSTSHKNNASVKLEANDVLDLSQWKYFKEVKVEQKPEEVKEVKVDKDLESAISFNKDEGQISGLG